MLESTACGIYANNRERLQVANNRGTGRLIGGDAAVAFSSAGRDRLSLADRVTATRPRPESSGPGTAAEMFCRQKQKEPRSSRGPSR